MEEIGESSPLLSSENGTPPPPHHPVNGLVSPIAIQAAVPSSYHPTSGDEEAHPDVTDGKRYPFHETPSPVDHNPKLSVKVYPSRFWILGLFSMMALFQCLQWNTWGPISASVNAAYSGWGSDTVAMMANWGTITFVLTIVPMCWLMNTDGLRAGVFCCAMLIACGTVLRVMSFMVHSATVFTISCHLCAILNGIAGTLVMAGPPMIASQWFPPKERTTATAIAQIFNQLGNGFSYLEPLLVRSPVDASPEEIRKDIKVLMYIYGGIGVALLLAIYVYYPAKPPTPPSLSSSAERLEFWGSMKKMLRNRDVILVTLAYGISVGIPSAWIAVFNYSLQVLKIQQDDAMWIGLSIVLVSAAVALIAGRLTDLLYGHVRISLIIIMVLSLGCFYWFYLITYGTIPVVLWQVYFTAICGFSLNFTTCPLFFELAVESAYPIPEILVGGLLTGMNNLVGLIFLFLFFIPNIGYSWVTYVLLSTCSLSILPLILVKEDYSRSNLDRGTTLQSSYQPI